MTSLLRDRVETATIALAPGLTPEQELKYLQLSPFEVTSFLIEIAEKSCRERVAAGRNCKVLNVGRGNPNFLNTLCRKAFAKLSMFAADIAEKGSGRPWIGYQPSMIGLTAKLQNFLVHDQSEESEFLSLAVNYAIKRFQFDPDEFVFELVDAALGDFYPEPPRILRHVEKIVDAYLHDVLLSVGNTTGKFTYFATEGATSAMTYIFKSLIKNHVLNQGDFIATITPIFSPYLEIPELEDYQFVEIKIKQSEDAKWQIPLSELEKLKDQQIKVLYFVNPTNPTAVGLSRETVDKIAEIIENERQDLIIISDTVYATFVDDFYCLINRIPQNTLCIYSYSKYFGVTGWRLGIIMLHENNVIDKIITHLPTETQAVLAKRYQIVTTHPEKLKFIERIEIDSRDVALAHTGGISGPQQCIMCLFSLFELIDEQNQYKGSIHDILENRIRNLYANLPADYPYPEGENKTHYYVLINLRELAEILYGEEFAIYLTSHFLAIDFLFKLAIEETTICLPGAGFGAPEWTLRVSLANIIDNEYITVGQNIIKVLEKYFEYYQKMDKLFN